MAKLVVMIPFRPAYLADFLCSAAADCSGGPAECEPRILSTAVNIFPAGPPRWLALWIWQESLIRFGEYNICFGLKHIDLPKKHNFEL